MWLANHANPTDRMMARIAISIFTLGALYGMYALGPPVYWRFYATVVKPFEDPSFEPLDDDPFAAAFIDQHPGAHAHGQAAGGKGQAGGGAAGTGTGTGAGAATTKPAVNPVAVASPPPKVVLSPPPAQRPPPKEVVPENYPLTMERVKPLLQNGYIMVTWANEHYLDFAVSWVAGLKRVGITGYMVGAMDDDMLRSLVRRDINTWRMNTGITKADLGWGSQNFHKMGRSKINLIKQFLAFEGVTVVISDIDTAWLRSPLPFFDRFATADILTSTDELRPSVKTEDLERYPESSAAFNIGIMMFRPKSREFVDAWVKSLENPSMWDQTAFNDIVRKGATPSGPDGLFKGFNGQLTVGILPCSQFSSGHVFFVQRKYEELGLKPYVAHATFQYSGTPGKRHRFREAMLFEDPPEYYDHAKGFITFTMDLPKALLDEASGKNSQGEMKVANLVSHFALVNHQLLRLRAAIALGQLTGRVVVLPPIWCELDKYWAPLYNGNIPGSTFRKPFICPMDHVLDIEGGWHPKKPVVEFGPHVEWREYSFFQNPRMSKAVNESRLLIEVCGAGAAGCADGSGPGAVTGNRMKLQGNLDSGKLAKALNGTEKFKVLDFSSLASLWPTFREDGGWFTSPDDHRKFVNRLKLMTSVVCCLQDNPGWIWYDLLWDVPHKDRFGRVFDKWHIKRGDQDLRGRRQLLAIGDGSEDGLAALGAGEDEAGQHAVAMSAAHARWLQDMQYQAMHGSP